MATDVYILEYIEVFRTHIQRVNLYNCILGTHIVQQNHYIQVFIMSLGHFLRVYRGLEHCTPELQYIGKTGFFVFVMIGNFTIDHVYFKQCFFICIHLFKIPRKA